MVVRVVVVEALRRRQRVRLQVALDTRGQRQRVQCVHGRRLPHYRPTTELLQTEHLVRPPDPLHAVPVQGHPSQLAERLANVKVTQRGNLEAGHLVPHRVQFGCLGGDLALKFQVQAIAHEDLGHSRSVFFDFFQPPVDPIETPLVRYVVDQYDALGTSRVAADDCAEAPLSRGVPQLEAHPFAV